jgi:hypothetical protein
MTITTEEAEWLADWVEEKGGLSLRAAGLRALAAERDALRAERNAERNARFKAEAEFSHMQRRIARQRRALAKLYRKRHDRNGRLSSFVTGLTAENARLRKLVAYLAGTNKDHVQVALAGNPIVCNAIHAEALAALGETQ